MTPEEIKFLGVWELQSFTTQYDSEDIKHPLGKDALGILSYGADRYVHVTLQSKNFPNFQLDDRQLVSEKEKVSAFDNFYSYVGKWFLENGLIHHHIILSIMPNWINKTIVRTPIWISENTLNLNAEWSVNNKKRIANLVWNKIL